MPLFIKGNQISSNDITSTGAFRSKINRDGLICHLDAANINSYPGSGTSWVDLSGNGNNGTLVGSVSFSSSNGGVFTLPGSVGSYIDVPINMTSSNYTVIGSAKYLTAVVTHTNGQGGRIISAKNNNWLMGHWNGTTENFYSEGWITSVGNGPTDTNWRILSSSGNISEDQYIMYVNGNPTVSNQGGSAGPNGFAIGQYGPGNSEYANGQVGIFLVYNRVLNPFEIAEVYQAIRGRYSI
jgi:hypothetical protein